MIDHLKNGQSTLELCEDWWEQARKDTVLFEIHRIFKDESIKKPIRKNLILQMISVTLLGYFES